MLSKTGCVALITLLCFAALTPTKTLAGETPFFEIAGPNDVADNWHAQYRLLAHADDDTTVDITAAANWSVEPNDVASVTMGLLTTEMVDLPLYVTISAEYDDGQVVQLLQKEVFIFPVCPGGGALQFDGVDDYVACGNDESLDITDAITVSAWIKCPTFNTHGTIVGKNNGNSVTAGYGLFSYVQGFEFNFYSGGRWRRTAPRVPVTPGQWHHVAGTFDGNTAYLYIDGEQKASLAQVGTITPATGHSLNIAYWRPALPEYFGGLIDEVAIYNRALSADEIGASMHTRPDTANPDLAAYWSFNELDGQIAADLTGRNQGILGSTADFGPDDPTWVYSDAPVGICTLDALVQRNVSYVLNIKAQILDLLNTAISKEAFLLSYVDEAFRNRELGSLSKGDVAKAKQKVMAGMQQERQAKSAVEQSREKLTDALNTLGIE
jgi:hypothetical protein